LSSDLQKCCSVNPEDSLAKIGLCQPSAALDVLQTRLE
jgi:hypothetical protein